jgi:DNA-directed RNA polymerase specialized sigma24 family protein
MDRQPDDPMAANDLTLVQAARSGDRLAFGVLYLRHHAAAWRIACVVSRFSPDAELAVIEGFTRVFSALPADSEEFERGGVTFRPYLLACVRQAALNRARAARRAEPASTRRPGRAPASPPPPAPLAGLAPDGEVVLSSMEHHIARGALAALPERTRTALWLSDVEAMTPAEVAGILGSEPEVVAALAAEARAGVRSAQDSAHGRHEVRSDCRFTVEHLGAYHAGALDPKKGVLVRSHLDLCPPCRMRLGEFANGPATLAAAVPAAPLLGGEAQHHWLTAAAEVRPAERLLPPGIAAAAPVWHFPDVLRPMRDHRRRRVAAVAGAVPGAARKVGRRVSPAVPALTLVVAWLGVMLSLPQLMQPGTAPGPGGLALPAVQAYVPDFLPGAAKSGSGNGKGSRSSQPSPASAVAQGGSELAAQFTSGPGRTGAAGLGRGDAAPTVALISTATSAAPRARVSRPEGRAPLPAPATGAVEATPTVVTSVVPVAPLLVAAPPPTPVSPPETKPISESNEPKNESNRTEKDSKQVKKDSRQAEKESKKVEKEARRAEKDSQKVEKGLNKAERKRQPVSRGKIVQA